MIVESFSCGKELGYFGPGKGKLVVWGEVPAQGIFFTFSEYLGAYSLQLGRVDDRY